MKIKARDVPPRAVFALEKAGIPTVLARIFAARGITSASELTEGLEGLLPPSGLMGIEQAARILADAIQTDKRMCIVADYDCDGATACAVAVRGLRLLGGHHVEFLVPDRINDGYGLTPKISERVKERAADVLITVDNGIASVTGVERAKELGLQVIITDHHLPGDALPQPDAMVNPNQPGCTFESKSMAGVGVMFYVLMAVRKELRDRGAFENTPQPKLDSLLPIVALGTVADVVKLDNNNRRLVAQGLRRIHAGQMPAGIDALLAAAKRDPLKCSTFDFGFSLGPRINAAGRLADMTLGIECLITDDKARAAHLATELDSINRERRAIETDMREEAMATVDEIFKDPATAPSAVCVYRPEFHEGVVGIVASRLKDKLHRPCFVFAQSAAEGKEGEIKGSGRSIPGFHLRDAIDLVAKRHPGVLIKFGGHAMAAGCTVAAEHFAVFEQALAQVAQEWLTPADLTQTLQTDGTPGTELFDPALVARINSMVWGQGFATPSFSDIVQVRSQKVVAEKHLSLKLTVAGREVDGIFFGRLNMLPARCKLAFRPDINEWKGQRKVQLIVEGVEDANENHAK